MRLQLDTSISSQLTGTSGSAATTAAKTSNANTSTNTASTGDSSSLSGTANLLSQLASQHASHIAQLTTAVRGGSYDVPSAAISRAIVDEAYA